MRQLALQYPTSPLNSGPFLIYLTARDKGRGEAALKQLQDDPQLKRAKALQSDGGLSTIEYHQLDITDSKSLTSFVNHLRQAHGEGVDFVINNAGIAMNGFGMTSETPLPRDVLTTADSNVVRTTLGCNYYCTMEASHSFLPLLKPGGRLVNVASVAGKLNRYSNEIRNRFLASKTEEDVTSIMQDFAAAVDARREKEAGFPSAAYAVSKAGLIGATRALALSQKEAGSSVLINSCCPGYVNTDMTKGNGVLTPDQGAQTPVKLAIGDIQHRSGEFWHEGKPADW